MKNFRIRRKKSLIRSLLLAMLFLGGSVLYATFPSYRQPHPFAFEDARSGSVWVADALCRRQAFAQLNRSAAAAREKVCESREQHRLDTNDLIQQTRAANAAEVQADLAAQVAWLSYVQMIGGILTLAAAAGAAWYARDAARAGWWAAQAAKDSLDHDRNLSAQADRPWLKLEIEPASDWRIIADGAHKVTFDVKISNIGNRVAQNALTTVKLYQGSQTDHLEDARKEALAVLAESRNHSIDLTNVLHGDTVILQRHPSLKIQGKGFVHALACVTYDLPDGSEGFSWSTFVLETDVDGQRRAVRNGDAPLHSHQIVPRSRGWTGAQ